MCMPSRMKRDAPKGLWARCARDHLLPRMRRPPFFLWEGQAEGARDRPREDEDEAGNLRHGGRRIGLPQGDAQTEWMTM